jgi:hypothetical protein
VASGPVPIDAEDAAGAGVHYGSRIVLAGAAVGAAHAIVEKIRS